jgi:chemotaxis protein methyltransferase CheR
MTSAQDTSVLGEASGLIAERIGLHFPEERWPDLARGLKSAGEELGFKYPDTCVPWLRSERLTARQIEELAGYLTVGETYFFRDPASFEALERKILSPLAAERAESCRTFRLWSAGCCTGEEAYSLAITCARALPDLQRWNVSILGTDINPKFLAKAEAGVYGEWSFRGAPDWLRGQYFSPAPDKKLSIDPAVKNLVHFDYLNLAADVYPSLYNFTNAMDVIFCRNVLMYFTAEHQRLVAAALHRCLVDGGCLLVNPAEASASLFSMFSLEEADGVIIYRKTSKPIRAEYWPGFVSPPPASAVSEPAFIATPAQAGPVEPARSAPPIAAPTREAPLVVARAYASQGRLEEALSACRDAIANEPSNPIARFLYATICHELGRNEEAIATMGRVLYLDQDFILAHHALGGLCRQLGKSKESKRHFAIALEILSSKGKDEIVPESGGITCGRLMESIEAITGA